MDGFYRTLPLVYKTLGQIVEDARAAGDLTEQKIVQQKMDTIADPYYLSFGIGVVQILDGYWKVSLNAKK